MTWCIIHLQKTTSPDWPSAIASAEATALIFLSWETGPLELQFSGLVQLGWESLGTGFQFIHKVIATCFKFVVLIYPDASLR